MPFFAHRLIFNELTARSITILIIFTDDFQFIYLARALTAIFLLSRLVRRPLLIGADLPKVLRSHTSCPNRGWAFFAHQLFFQQLAIKFGSSSSRFASQPLQAYNRWFYGSGRIIEERWRTLGGLRLRAP